MKRYAARVEFVVEDSLKVNGLPFQDWLVGQQVVIHDDDGLPTMVVVAVFPADG